MLSDRKIDRKDYDRLMKATTYKNCKYVMSRVQTKSGQYPVLEKIVDFVIENWDEILKILLMLSSLVAVSDED